MKYVLKTACILLLLTSFIHSTYSQTFSLQGLNEQKAGLGFAYNQTEFESWSHGIDATDHNAHLVIPIKMNDFSQLSIMPCVIYRNEKSESIPIDVNLNAGCYVRYGGIYNTTIPNFFYRVGGGGNNNALEATDPFNWVWKGHGGAGIFWDLDKTRGIPLKLFSGLFIQGKLERQIEESVTYNQIGYDISIEFGVEINTLKKQSLSITCLTYLYNTYEVSNISPKLYFSYRIL